VRRDLLSRFVFRIISVIWRVRRLLVSQLIHETPETHGTLKQ